MRDLYNVRTVRLLASLLGDTTTTTTTTTNNNNTIDDVRARDAALPTYIGANRRMALAAAPFMDFASTQTAIACGTMDDFVTSMSRRSKKIFSSSTTKSSSSSSDDDANVIEAGGQVDVDAAMTWRARWTTAIQSAVLLALLTLTSTVVVVSLDTVMPAIVKSDLASSLLLTLSFVVAATLALLVFSVALTLGVKKLLIGHYRPGAHRHWSSFYARHWIVQCVAKLIPWSLVEGTVFHVVVLRLLGARIGRRVHIGRECHLEGAWDLLDIGDDVTVKKKPPISVVFCF